MNKELIKDEIKNFNLVSKEIKKIYDNIDIKNTVNISVKLNIGLDNLLEKMKSLM